jgi:hypothetical protein
MSGPHDPLRDVGAPLNTLAWTASRGWLDNPADVVAAVNAGDQPFMVDDDGLIRDVACGATITLAMLVDKRVLSVSRQAEEADADLAERAAAIGPRVSEHADRVDAVARSLKELRKRLRQLAKAAGNLFAGRS